MVFTFSSRRSPRTTPGPGSRYGPTGLRARDWEGKLATEGLGIEMEGLVDGAEDENGR